MCASLEACGVLSHFSLISISCYLTALVRAGQQRVVMQFWLTFTTAQATVCLLLRPSFCHSNSISEYIVESHFPHEIWWLMSFTQVESQYWCKALSALCCCSISLFIQWGVYTSWAAGSRDCIDQKWGACVVLEDRWFGPLFCSHGSVNEHILYMCL